MPFISSAIFLKCYVEEDLETKSGLSIEIFEHLETWT